MNREGGKKKKKWRFHIVLVINKYKHNIKTNNDGNHVGDTSWL